MRIQFYKISVTWAIVFALSSFIWLMPGKVLSQAPPADSTDIQREVVRSVYERFGFRRGSGFGAVVGRNGRVTGIRGIPVNVDSTFRLVDWAYDFLERNVDLFGIADPRQELRLSRDRGNIVRLQQVVNGMAVHHARTQIELSVDRTYAYFDIHYYPDARNVNTIPTIDSLEAGRIGQADPEHGDAQTYACCYELLIAPFADGVHLVWKVGIEGGAYDGSASYMIDAHNGEILEVKTALKR